MASETSVAAWQACSIFFAEVIDTNKAVDLVYLAFQKTTSTAVHQPILYATGQKSHLVNHKVVY